MFRLHGDGTAGAGRQTGNQRYLDAARRAFAYERGLYDEAARNWPDLRTTTHQPSGAAPAFGTFCCHGAPRIALARIRAMELGHDPPTIAAEAEIALATTACESAWGLTPDRLRRLTPPEVSQPAAYVEDLRGVQGSQFDADRGQQWKPNHTFVGVVDLVADVNRKATVVNFKTAASAYPEYEAALSDQLPPTSSLSRRQNRAPSASS